MTNRYTLLLFFTAAVPGVSGPLQSGGDRPFASIKGTVTNSVTGERLRKAYVRLQETSGSGSVWPAVTDEKGAFSFHEMEPGSYRLEAERQGYLEGQYGGELRLAAGQSLTDVNVRLIPQAAISGRVLDETGDVWTHARVAVYRAVWRHGRRELQPQSEEDVDDRGCFRIGQLPPGRYYISAKPDERWERMNRWTADEPAQQLQRTWYPSAPSAGSSTPVMLTPGQELPGLELRFRRGSVYVIGGKVSGLKAVPPMPNQGAFSAKPRVWAEPVAEAGDSYSGSLYPDGSFEVRGVPAGAYEIKIVQGLYPRFELGRAAVQINDRDVDDVAITVQPPRALRGVIRIEGDEKLSRANMSVELISLDARSFLPTAVSRPDGSFDFEYLAAGRYQLGVRGRLSDDFYLKLVRDGVNTWANGLISLSGSESPIEVILSTRGARLKGSIKVSGDMRALPEGFAPQVVLIPETANAEQREYGTKVGVVDQRGVFTFKMIAPGKYTLYAFENAPEESWTNADFLKEIKNRGVDIDVIEGDVKNVELPLVRKADIESLFSRLGID